MALTPLHGYRVLDLSRVLAGPWASLTLADLGAQVIKIEAPGTGDETRRQGLPVAHAAEGKETADSACFRAANRGKYSVTVNLANPAGQEIIRDLCRISDVFIENYKAGALAQYNLDYPGLQRINARLVYCSINDCGLDGPYKADHGDEYIVQAMDALRSISGKRDDGTAAGPQKVGLAIADIVTGLYAANAIQAALLERVQSGHGQHIDLALPAAQVAMQAPAAGQLNLTGTPMHFSRTPGPFLKPPPLPGEDTERVLKSMLGYSAARLNSLTEEGSI